MKIKIKLKRFTPSNLNFFSFKFSVLKICISTDVLEFLKDDIFLHLVPSNFFITNETFLLMRFADCLPNLFFFDENV